MTQERSDPMEALYPFLYADSSDLDAVLDQVRQSTVDKVREILQLRERVGVSDGPKLMACAREMAARFASGGRLLACGNGGSSTDAQDMATRFMNPSHGTVALPAFGLTGDIAVVTALSNDITFDIVFARQIAAFGRREDIVVGLSTSGNSENLLQAFTEANRHGMLTVGIAGYSGGKMANLGLIDYLFVVPSPSVHRIQEAQTTIYHALCELTADMLPATQGTGTR